MQKIILTTEDGSNTISIPGIGVTYHSKFGAIAESNHIFMDAALRYMLQEKTGTHFSVLEIGFGTGLNALLTAILANEQGLQIDYTSLETNPLNQSEWMQLNHGTCLGQEALFGQLHRCEWEQKIRISDHFRITKQQISLIGYHADQTFDCIFFDAFAPDVQPELWTVSVFETLFGLLNPGGVLTTYSSKTVIRKAMQEAGFTLEKIPGPRGKREIVRARKIL